MALGICWTRKCPEASGDTAGLNTWKDEDLLNGEVFRDLTESEGDVIEVHESEHSHYRDGVFAEEWITRQFGFDESILSEHWQ